MPVDRSPPTEAEREKLSVLQKARQAGADTLQSLRAAASPKMSKTRSEKRKNLTDKDFFSFIYHASAICTNYYRVSKTKGQVDVPLYDFLYQELLKNYKTRNEAVESYELHLSECQSKNASPRTWNEHFTLYNEKYKVKCLSLIHI